MLDAGSRIIPAYYLLLELVQQLSSMDEVDQAEYALLRGRACRTLGLGVQADTWLKQSENSLKSMLSRPQTNYMIGELENHRTLLAIDGSKRPSQRVIQQLRYQAQATELRLEPDDAINLRLELLQRRADVRRQFGDVVGASGLVFAGEYLDLAAEMGPHNLAHRLMYATLMHIEGRRYADAWDLLCELDRIPIAHTEPSLRVLWLEKRLRFAKMVGDDTSLEDLTEFLLLTSLLNWPEEKVKWAYRLRGL